MGEIRIIKEAGVVCAVALMEDVVMLTRATSRQESWGTLRYHFERDEFTADVHYSKKGVHLVPSAPIGIGWVIIGGCNLRCIHCYGNSEELPRVVLSTEECLEIVDKMAESKILRVVISGGEPMLRDDIFDIIQALHRSNISVVLGTNGSFICLANVDFLRVCKRVEVSFDAATPELFNQIRPSRQKGGDAWEDTIRAIKLCLESGLNLRTLTALNTWNQYHIVAMAGVLDSYGVKDWALSWTIPAGRARAVYDQLRPQVSAITEQLNLARLLYPELNIRYSGHGSSYSRHYCLILPDGQIATEDINQGGKVSFGHFIEVALADVWNNHNYNLAQHFQKWLGNRCSYISD